MKSETWLLGLEVLRTKSDFDKVAFSALKWQHTDWQGIKDLMGLEDPVSFAFKEKSGMVVEGIWGERDFIFNEIRVW